MFPFAVRWLDGTETSFTDLEAHTRALVSCRHEYAQIVVGPFRGIACWKCLSYPADIQVVVGLS